MSPARFPTTVPIHEHLESRAIADFRQLILHVLLVLAGLILGSSNALAQNQNCPHQPYEYRTNGMVQGQWVGSRSLSATMAIDRCVGLWSEGNGCGGNGGWAPRTYVATGACTLTGPDSGGVAFCPYAVYSDSTGALQGNYDNNHTMSRRNTQVCPPDPPPPIPDVPAQDVCPVGNPVCPATGTKYLDERDYEAPNGLELRRQYASARPFPTPLFSSESAFGNFHWLHSYERSLHVLDLAATGGMKWVAKRPDGHLLYFGIDGKEILNRTSTGQSSKVDVIIGGSGWNLKLANGDTERYDSSGRLLSITSRAGLVTSIGYDAQLRISTVTASHGHSLQFFYDGLSRLDYITNPSGGQIHYDYDSNGRLESVTYTAVRTTS